MNAVTLNPESNGAKSIASPKHHRSQTIEDDVYVKESVAFSKKDDMAKYVKDKIQERIGKQCVSEKSHTPHAESSGA